MAKWLTSAVLQNYVSEDTLKELTNDATGAPTINTTVLDAAIAAAESELGGSLIPAGYSTDYTAGTASPYVEQLAARLCLGILAQRRKRRSELLDDARVTRSDVLPMIRQRYISVPEWTRDSATATAKIEPQHPDDTYASWEDESLIASDSEHSGDVR